MPAEISLDAVDLDVENLETIPLDPNHLPDSYPLPMLRRTGQRRVATIRTAILQNAYLRLTFALDLGGRMIGLCDKRTGIDILPRLTRLDVEEGGCRGVQTTWRGHLARADAGLVVLGDDYEAGESPLPQPLPSATIPVSSEHLAGAGEGGRTVGLQVVLGNGERPNALGPVDFQIREAEDDADPVELWMFELVVGNGLSWHQRVVLAPDRAEFAFEIRLMNRELRPWPCAFGWSLGVERSVTSIRSPNELIVAFPDRDAGLWIGTERGLFQPCADGQGLNLWRVGPEAENLLPREVLSGGITVVPFSGVGAVSDACREGALSVQPGRLFIQSSGPLPDQKVVIKTRSGQVMEAKLDLLPERLHEIALPEPILAAAVKATGRDSILRWEPADSEQTDVAPRIPARVKSGVRDRLQEAAEGSILEAFAGSKPDEVLLFSGLDSPVLGGLARLGLAIRALEAGEMAEGEHLLDEALERCSHDPLMWWFRSVRMRTGDERADLLNAHYLAPLEPMLRAESFLSVPSEEHAPSPLVAPLAASPDQLVEVACLLLVHRRLEDAARWIDECLRHRSVPMLHLLMAWSLLEGTGLRAEGSNHLRKALSMPPEPPFPWRPIERVAVDRLRAEFPEEAKLDLWWKMASHGA